MEYIVLYSGEWRPHKNPKNTKIPLFFVFTYFLVTEKIYKNIILLKFPRGKKVVFWYFGSRPSRVIL
jgi:hypothetical protein